MSCDISISVVMPLWNKAGYVERALRSVFSQRIPPFELIVVDDGSTDGSAEIAERICAGTIGRVIRLGANKGVSAARNAGVNAAHGEYIAFLDADDEWRDGFIEQITKLIECYPGCGLYATHHDIVFTEGEYVRDNPWLKQSGKMSFFDTMHDDREVICSSCVGVPRQVLEEAGGFPIEVRFTEDIVTWIRIGVKYPVAISAASEAIYYRNVVGQSVSVGKGIMITAPKAAAIRGALSEYPDNASLRRWATGIYKSFLWGGWRVAGTKGVRALDAEFRYSEMLPKLTGMLLNPWSRPMAIALLAIHRILIRFV